MIAYFLFYKVSSGVQAKLAFSSEFKHCNIVTFDGKYWIATEFDSTGIITRVIDVDNSESFMRGLKHIDSLVALVVVDITERKRHAWFPWWVRSCNELDRYISGVDIGFTFNPIHLFKKLLKYGGKRNYEILYAWRRSYGILWRGR